MKLLPLYSGISNQHANRMKPNGLFTKVDDEDYDFLMQWRWHKKIDRSKRGAIFEYVCRAHKSKTIRMHRVVMKENNSKIFIDHKDHDGLNNQKNNLRRCTKNQNPMNKKSAIGATSKYLGVSLYKTKWRAQLSKGGKRIYIGQFNTEVEAALAYNECAKKYHGEFANPNII